MADKETLAFLLRSIATWNKWRDVNNATFIDLTEADLTDANLRNVNLNRAILTGANLAGANLAEANLEGSVLTGANLRKANLFHAALSSANLERAVLAEAQMEGANLTATNLRKADLERANLSRVTFFSANLTGANLSEANLTGAMFGETVVCDLDLSHVIALNTIKHCADSTVGLDTLRKSKGNIPTDFLRQCGMSLWEIEMTRLYEPGLSDAEISDILCVDILRKRIGGP